MKLLIFSDTHIASNRTKEILEYHTEYESFQKLLKLFHKFDLIINLGDFLEPVYDLALPNYDFLSEYYTYKNVVKICGNHDKKDGLTHFVYNGIRYEHGHRSGVQKDVDAIRAFYGTQKIIHGHSHVVNNTWSYDVGSITFNDSYAVVKDDKVEIKYI